MAATNVVIIGGGRSGAAILRSLERRGCSVRLLSRSTGFDVLRDDARTAIGEADVVIEATGLFTTSHAKATAFFTASTTAIATAANQVGAHHVLLSIVNCMLPQVQGYGYFAGKTAQENAAREQSRNLTIVRSTQWFEFASQTLERMRFGPIALVPQMAVQPVALDTVADVMAEVAVGDRSAPVAEVAGPERTTLWNMTKSVPRRGVTPVPLPIPGRMGRAFRNGALLPDPRVEILGPRFSEWTSST